MCQGDFGGSISSIRTVHGRRGQRYGGGRWGSQNRQGGTQHIQPISPSTHLLTQLSHGSHTVLLSCFKMMLINARSVNKNNHLIHSLIVAGNTDLGVMILVVYCDQFVAHFADKIDQIKADLDSRSGL